MSIHFSNKVILVFAIRALLILPLASCSTTDNVLFPDNGERHTVNDLSTVTCVFHLQAMGQPIDDTARYTRDSSVSIGRAQRDCYEKGFKDDEE